jgi:PP-loop superfamily ATP-utilizing enzyme
MTPLKTRTVRWLDCELHGMRHQLEDMGELRRPYLKQPYPHVYGCKRCAHAELHEAGWLENREANDG